MAVLDTGESLLYYEEHGEGFPLLLFAPGGMNSQVQYWLGSPAAPDVRLPWINPTVDLADTFRVIAVDQRNAGRSRARVRATDSWASYISDAISLLDYLGIERTHAMGGCIGSSYVLGLIQAAPERVAAAVLQNPIGLTAENRPLFFSMFDEWATTIGPDHPEADGPTWEAFREAMFGGEFVFSVSRDFVRQCTAPLLVLPGGDPFHPRDVALEIAGLAPEAEVLEPWAGETHKPATREAILAFLAARQ